MWTHFWPTLRGLFLGGTRIFAVAFYMTKNQVRSLYVSRGKCLCPLRIWTFARGLHLKMEMPISTKQTPLQIISVLLQTTGTRLMKL